MIEAILKGIFTLIINLVNLLLYPIDALISNALPSLNDGLNMVSNFITWGCDGIRWAVSWTGLNSSVIALLVAYLTFNLTLPLAVSSIKLAIKWYHNLAP